MNITPIPSNVVARLTVPCSGLDRPQQQHTIFITRSGNVNIPDHENSEAENIATALGQKHLNTCEYWWNVPGKLMKSLTSTQKNTAPDVTEWSLETVNAWTTAAVWTTLSGMLGERCHERNDPKLALAYIQAYQRNHGMPEDPATHLTLLAAPWTRESGWRRTRATTPAELDELLKTGIPSDLASSIAALDITPSTLHIALGYLHTFSLPQNLIPQLAAVVEPERIPEIVSQLTKETADYLPWRVRMMWATSRTEDIPTEKIVDYLLSPAPPEQ